MKKILLATAAMLLAAPTSVLAGNYINLDATAANTGITTLSITQDAAHPSNSITGNGSQGTSFLVRGPWNNVTVNQYGGGDGLSGSIKSATGSTTASLNATYGASAGGGTQGFNTHALTVGATNAPSNPHITVSVANTNATPGSGNKNAITDVIDVNGGSLTYGLTVTGDSNTLGNTVSAGGSTTLSETVTASNSNTLSNTLTGGGTVGYTLAASGGDANAISNSVTATGAISVSQTLNGGANSITNSIGGTTPVASYNEAISVTGGNNSIGNAVDGAGAKTVNVSLASSGNSVTNGMSGTGAQTSSLTADSGTLVNYTLTAGTNASPLAGGSSSSVILSNVIGAAAAAGLVNVTQSGAGANLNLTVNGGAFTVGGGGVNVTQASTNAALVATVNAAANGYSYTISQ
jgi:hypothetical protein